MSSALWELQRAVHQTLTGHAALVEALGGARIYDHVPQGTAFPYVALAAFSARDWVTATEPGTEITFTLHVWSRAGGHKQALALAEAVRSALHDAPLALSTHHLVNLRHETSESRRERERDTYRVALRFRAVLEPTA